MGRRWKWWGFGSSVSTAGDVNGDGYAEVLIASPNSDSIGFDAGWVDLYYGNRQRGVAMIPRPRAGG